MTTKIELEAAVVAAKEALTAIIDEQLVAYPPSSPELWNLLTFEEQWAEMSKKSQAEAAIAQAEKLLSAFIVEEEKQEILKAEWEEMRRNTVEGFDMELKPMVDMKLSELTVGTQIDSAALIQIYKDVLTSMESGV